MHLYLDVCSLSRPYDDQSIDRSRLEAEAVMVIIGRVNDGKHSLVSSEVIDREVAACPDLEKAELIKETLRLSKQYVALKVVNVTRSQELTKLGFHLLDSMHLACAEAADCDYFVTTDNKLIAPRRSERR